MLTVEQRLSNLENLVHALSQKIDNNKFYADADMQGNRQSISNVTPYTETKTAYIGDREVLFKNVPKGNLTVYGLATYNVTRTSYDAVLVYWETPLEEVTEVTISIQ